MMKLRMIACGALAAVALCLAPATTQAQDGCVGGYYGLPSIYGYGYSGNLYGLNYIPVPPYFALHPPVYYGEQVYRDYGQSPFAARPCTVPVEVQRVVQPEMVTNPYVEQIDVESIRSQQEPADDRVASKPLEILNPFVTGAQVAGLQILD